jgi:protein TonB
MFEDSLFESQVRAVSPRGRWTAAASIAVQAAVASLLVVVSLLHTELMPVRGREIAVALPLPAPPPPPRTISQQVSSAAASIVPVLGRMLAAPRITPSGIDLSADPPGTPSSFTGFGAATLPGTLVGDSATNRVPVSVAPEKKPGMVHISSGVSTGLLLAPIRPIYPPIARATHVEGTVVVEAIISKAGTIESLRVASGPEMLRSAAMEAIRAARYQPFRLNGEPTEVQTTITVNFRMGS